MVRWIMGKKHLHLTEYVNGFFFWINLGLGRSHMDVLKILVAENWSITIGNRVK